MNILTLDPKRTHELSGNLECPMRIVPTVNRSQWQCADCGMIIMMTALDLEPRGPEPWPPGPGDQVDEGEVL